MPAGAGPGAGVAFTFAAAADAASVDGVAGVAPVALAPDAG